MYLPRRRQTVLGTVISLVCLLIVFAVIKVLERGDDWEPAMIEPALHGLATGLSKRDVREIQTKFTPALREFVPPSALEQAALLVGESLGAYRGLGERQESPEGWVKYRLVFEKPVEVTLEARLHEEFGYLKISEFVLRSPALRPTVAFKVPERPGMELERLGGEKKRPVRIGGRKFRRKLGLQ